MIMRTRRGKETGKCGDNYKKGQWNVLCDYSGFEIASGDAKRTWDGFVVHKRFWENRQPQDFVRGVKDNIATPPHMTRPDPEDDFLTANEVTIDDL